MSFKSAILITLFCGHILAQESAGSLRKRKFLDITGYLSGSADGFRLVPFWKQWNAFLQVNIEKNKHKHNGIYVLPASAFYYPPYNGYGFYVPPNFGELGGGLIHPNALQSGLQTGYRPMTLLFDDYKPATTKLPTLNADIADKPKFNVDENDLDSMLENSEKEKKKFNLRDTRKSHKRDIEQKNQTENEVAATVVEITDVDIVDTTTVASTTESLVDSMATATTTTTTTTTNTETETPDLQTTTTTTTETMETTTPAIPIVSLPSSTIGGNAPILSFYYGGTPNENANYIYFTTSEPTQNLAPPTESPNAANDRSDFGDFRPSIQYEYRNYRYNTDPHFVPIVGTKQIF